MGLILALLLAFFTNTSSLSTTKDSQIITDPNGIITNTTTTNNIITDPNGKN